MGLFRTQDAVISKAMPLTGAMIASIDVRPAWEFQNQSGVLGTNLNNCNITRSGISNRRCTSTVSSYNI
jgi:hypothetical protein